jgi:hypothetical protein
LNILFFNFFSKDKVNDIHGWNCAFEEDTLKIKMLKESSLVHRPLDELLRGFFDFYATFQFHPHPLSSPPSFAASAASHNAFIISTRKAQVMHSTRDTHLSKLSAYINVQDPFDLSHNLTGNISKNTLQRFIVECKGSSDLMQQQNFMESKKAQTKCWGLMLLMTRKALPIMSASNTTNISIVASDLLKSCEKSQTDSAVSDNQEQSIEQLSVRKAIEFVMFILKECLLFEQLNNAEEMVIKKRKRIKALNQICDQVDSLGLSCSPKRLKTNQDPNKLTNTYVCLIDESLNNNGNSGADNVAEEDEEENENVDGKTTKRVANYILAIKHNTWQGRRAVKRDIKQHSPQSDDMELEIMTSKKLIESSKDRLPLKPISFRVLFNLKCEPADAKTHSSSPYYSNLEIKFDLLDEVRNQNDLINFTTIVHFLDIFINNCHEKFFKLWNCKEQTA